MAKTIALFIAMSVFGFSSFCSSEGLWQSDVPLFQLSAWRPLKLEYGDQLMLRRRSEAARNVLLLKHSRSESVYRYDDSNQTMALTTIADWDGAGTPTAECGRQSYPATDVVRIDNKSHQLLAGNRIVPTAGATALKLIAAPDGKYAAVLSAAGPADTSAIPFTGGSSASGPYFHQTISLADGGFVGKSVRLAVEHVGDSLIPCWSSDEHFVVYYHVKFNYASIVPSGLPDGAQSQR